MNRITGCYDNIILTNSTSTQSKLESKEQIWSNTINWKKLSHKDLGIGILYTDYIQSVGFVLHLVALHNSAAKHARTSQQLPLLQQ